MDLEKSREDSKERNEWLSVPAFGEWDLKQGGGGGVPDYSVDFTKIREMRKQHKRDPSRVSVGNEEELLTRHRSRDDLPHHRDHRPRRSPPPTTRKAFMSYFKCCTGA